MSRTIFYSWQNDLDSKSHRYFIEKCIKKALSDLEKDASIYMNYDRDTKGINGSPDITSIIFEKIDRCVLFICDVSIITPNAVGRKMPNPNVLVELGYWKSLPPPNCNDNVIGMTDWRFGELFIVLGYDLCI